MRMGGGFRLAWIDDDSGFRSSVRRSRGRGLGLLFRIGSSPIGSLLG